MSYQNIKIEVYFINRNWQILSQPHSLILMHPEIIRGGELVFDFMIKREKWPTKLNEAVENFSELSLILVN